MMTFIERRGWCPSLISSTKCPSTVGKSTKPCPVLSSSLASTSMISNGDSISLSTNSISPSSLPHGKREKACASLAQSSLDRANDYYTSKRIEELHERMDDLQIANFVTFVNYHLSLNKDHGKVRINDLAKDLANGHVLIDLVETLSATKLKRERGNTRFHSLTNVQIVLDYLKSRTQHINITPHEIVSGNRKQILALLWIIMKTFDFPGFRITNKNCFVENTLLGCGQDRSMIIKWLNTILNHSLNTIQIYINDFYIQTWINGYYLSIIIKYLIPLSIKYLTIKCFDYLKELDNATSVDKERLQLCFALSSYCFDTVTVIDDKDKSERCLFKYFTELQQNILNILKTNHIGKLIQNNPYTKQILDTVIQTTSAATEHSSHVINNNEQYLTCIKDDNHQGVGAVEQKELPLKARGPSTSTAGGPNELSNLRTVKKSRPLKTPETGEQGKRRNRWEQTELRQSDPPIVNNHSETPEEEQVKSTTNEQHLLNSAEGNFEQPTSSKPPFEQTRECEQPILAQQEVETCTPTAEQSTAVEERSEGKLDEVHIEVPEAQTALLSNKENEPDVIEDEISQTTGYCTQEKSDQPLAALEAPHELLTPTEETEQSNGDVGAFTTTEQQPSARVTVEVEGTHQSGTLNDEQSSFSSESQQFARPSVMPEGPHKPLSSTKTEQQRPGAFQELKRTDALLNKAEESITPVEKQMQEKALDEKVEQPDSGIDVWAATEEDLSASIEVDSAEIQSRITPNEEQSMTSNESGKTEQTTDSKPAEFPDDESKNSPTSEATSLITEAASETNENDTSVLKDTSKNASQPTTAGKKAKRKRVPNRIDNEIRVPSIVQYERADDKQSDETVVPVETIHAELSTVTPLTSLSEHQEVQSTADVNLNAIDDKLEQSTPSVMSKESPTLTLAETNPANITNCQFDKPTITTLKQAAASIDETNSRTAPVNRKSAMNSKRSPQVASSNKENRHSPATNKQSIAPVEQTATSKGDRCAHVISAPSLRINNESLQAAAGSERKVTSAAVSLDQPKQTVVVTGGIEQVPSLSGNKKSEQSEVPLEKQEQSNTASDQSYPSPVASSDTKKLSPKHKKSRRSNAKKVDTSAKTNDAPETTGQSEEESVEPSSSPLSLAMTAPEPQQNIVAEKISGPALASTTPSVDKSPQHNGISQTSSALRSRKNKKKKTIATNTTTVIEKPSLSPLATTPTTVGRQFLLTIQQCLLDRKNIAFKCVFILACLCFSIYCYCSFA